MVNKGNPSDKVPEYIEDYDKARDAWLEEKYAKYTKRDMYNNTVWSSIYHDSSTKCPITTPELNKLSTTPLYVIEEQYQDEDWWPLISYCYRNEKDANKDCDKLSGESNKDYLYRVVKYIKEPL